MNELIFMSIIIFNLGLCLFFFWLGRSWAMSYMAILSCTIITFAGMSIDFFGYSVALASGLYAGTYFITDMMAERYGRHVAQQAIFVSLAAWILMTFMMLAGLQLIPNEFSADRHQALFSVFETGPRLVFATIITLLIAQNFDVWFYHFLHKKTGGKLLWLRNNLSTMVSQFFDAIIWWGIAFYGVLDNWLELALAAYVIKVIVAACDTPFIYLSKVIKPLELLSHSKVEKV